MFAFSKNTNEPNYLIHKLTCWCWINFEDNLAFVIVTYAIYWMFIAYNILLVFRVVKFLRDACYVNEPECEKIKKMCSRLYLYPFVITICFTFGTIHRFYQKISFSYVDKDNMNEHKFIVRLEVVLYLLHGMFMSSRGFLIFVVYGYDAKVRNVFKGIYTKVAFWKRKKEILL